MRNQELIQKMADSFYDLLTLGYSFSQNKNEAFEYANSMSCAGSKAREIAADRFNETLKLA